MSDEPKKLPAGGRVQIVLRRKPKPRPAPTQAPQQPRGIIPVDDESPRYLRRKVDATVTFYDLGTRLRSVTPGTSFNALRVRLRGAQDVPERNDADLFVNEYVETQLSYPVSGDGLADEGWLTLTRELLGSRAPELPGHTPDLLDPFGESPANGTGRMVANCKPILMPGLSSGGRLVQEVGELMERERPEQDAAERWSPACVWNGNPTPPEAGYKLKKKRLGQLEQGLSFVSTGYRRFDTADTAGYKVTSEASFAAAAVPFPGGARRARVFLVPYLYRYTVSPDGVSVTARYAARVYTIYPAVIERQPGDVAEPRLSAHAQRTPDSGYAPGLTVFKDNLTPPVRAGSLAAVIALDSAAQTRLFYVWSRNDEAAYDSFAYPNTTELADTSSHAVNALDTANPLDFEGQSSLVTA